MDADAKDDDGDDSAVEIRLEQLLLRIDADDVTEEQMNWTKIGTCLHFQLAPVLRKYIQPVVMNLYETLKSSSGIDSQTKDNFLIEYPPPMGENYTQTQDSYKLHYRNINNNNFKFAQHKEQYVYSVTDAVELSKLFLPKQKETNYKDFERISLSSVLNLIINVSDFQDPLLSDARNVRDKIRNRWAHPEEYTWNGEQLSKCFAEIQHCIGSLQLPEEEHSKTLHQVLCLRYCETRNTLKKDIRNLIEDVIYTRISAGDFQRCPECLRRDIVSENQPDNNNLEINNGSPEMVRELWVRVIKSYSWLKDEMKKPHALCVAAQLLSPDDAELIHNSVSRLMAVDRLLKYVLRHETVYLCKFLKITDIHLKNALERKMEKIQLSKAEIEDCVRRNNQQIPDSNSFSLAEADKKSLLCKINTMKTIDFLNNGFLEGFFVSLAEHDNVCEYLHKSEFANGASCLMDIVEKRSYNVMYLLCYLLEQRQETGYIVEHLGLREKYCQARDWVTTETHNAEIGIYSTLQRKDDIDLKPTDFKVTGLELGSIVFRLCPRSTRSWEDLKRMCLSGDIINMLNHTFLDKEILKWMYVDEPRLLLTIYSEDSLDSMDEAQREAILKLNLMSEESDSTELACGSEENPLQSNIGLLCEELEINEDLIKLLKIKELVPSDISLELEQTNSRAAEIRCLLQKISFPEEGYKVIKEYLKYSNSYAYQTLLQTENTSRQRNLTYKCEACLRHRADSGTQTSEKDIDTEDLHEKSADTIHKAWKITWSKCFFEQHEHGGEHNKPADKATSTGDGLWSAEISEDSGVETVEIRQISDEKTSKGKSANIEMANKEDPKRVISEEEKDAALALLLVEEKTHIPDMDMPLQNPAQEEELKKTSLGMAYSVGSESVYGVSDELAGPFCDLCCQEGTIRRVAGYCPKCVEFFCWNCLADHLRMAATASHKIWQGSDMPACQADKPVKYQLCDEHDGEDKDRYCFDHGITICGICNRKEHKRCKVEAVSVALKEFNISAEKTSLSADVGLLLKHLRDTSQSIQSNKARLERKEKDILTEAQKERHKLLEKVDQSHQEFRAEVTSLFKDHTTPLSARQSALDEIAIKVDSILQGLQQSGQTKQNDQTEFLELYYYAEKVRLLEDKIKRLNLKQIDIHCTLTTNTQPLFVTKHKFGELSLQLAASQYSTELPRVHLPFTGRRQDPQKTIPGSGAISGHAVQSVRLAPLQKIKVKITDDKQDCFITGADFTVDGNILLADLDNRKVKLFSREGKLLSFLKLQDAAKQVAVIDKSEAAASMQKKQIGIIDIADSGHLNLKRIIITQQYVFGITTYNNNLIVTCGISSDRRRSIQMIDTREKVLWTTTTDSKGENMFDCADYLTTCFSDDGDSVIVTDKRNQKITVLDAGTGNVIKVYDVKGNKPLGVTIDNNGNVYVCYESGEITVWSSGMQGETRQTAESKCLKFPLAMACNRRQSELVLTSRATNTAYSNFVHRFKISTV